VWPLNTVYSTTIAFPLVQTIYGSPRSLTQYHRWAAVREPAAIGHDQLCPTGTGAAGAGPRARPPAAPAPKVGDPSLSNSACAVSPARPASRATGATKCPEGRPTAVRGPSVGGQTNSRPDVRPSDAIVRCRHLVDRCRRIGPGASLRRPLRVLSGHGKHGSPRLRVPRDLLDAQTGDAAVKVWNQRGTELSLPADITETLLVQ
jgi:hypothetical protein